MIRILAQRLLLLFLVLQPVLGMAAAPSGGSTPRPKLILVVVIDQFRADYLTRFEKRFLPAQGAAGGVGGFRWLMSQGAYFPHGQFDLLQCMTGPGHATVLTGAYPYQMGIPANDWYDEKTRQRVYCAQDLATATVGSTPKSPHVGTSPRNLIGTTVGDELKNSGYPSRVVSIAVKDRAAIMMGGHRADLALWFDQNEFKWVSSRWYLPDGKLPDWVEKINARFPGEKGKKYVWELPKNVQPTGFSLEDPMIKKDDWNQRLGGKFPHASELGSRGSMNLPYAIELTVEAAEKAVDTFKLGAGKATDLLAVSFSAHDYLAHAFGPNARELEEMTVAEDRQLAKLLNHVRKSVPGGLKNVSIVFTADHGGPNNPTWLAAQKVNAGRIDEEDSRKKVEAALTERFGKVEGDASKGERWITGVADLNFYLNQSVIAERKLDRGAVELVAKNVLKDLPGVAHVFSRGDYDARRLPPMTFERQILKTYFPGRSGDLIIIPLPFWGLNTDTVTHLTGYAYDRTVPIILAGFGFKTGVLATRAEVVDIAPTLSFLAGTQPPAVTDGRVLHEALATQK